VTAEFWCLLRQVSEAGDPFPRGESGPRHAAP
jgi:hypothetical protein